MNLIEKLFSKHKLFRCLEKILVNLTGIKPVIFRLLDELLLHIWFAQSILFYSCRMKTLKVVYQLKGMQ